MARVGRVDNRIDLQRGGHLHGAAVVVLAGQQLVKQGLALGAFGRSFQLSSEPQAHRALQPHSAKLTRRPRHGRQWRVEAARRHGHSAQAIALTQHHAQKWYAQMRRSNEHAADVAYLGRGFGIRPNHESGCINQADHRQAVGIAQLHKAGGFVSSVCINSAT